MSDADDVIEAMLARYGDALRSLGRGVAVAESDIGPAIDVIRAELVRLREQIADYENSTDWFTTCASCARSWDVNYDLYCREQHLRLMIALQQRAIANLSRERDAWKANHDNQVGLRRMVTSRPDLPLKMHPTRAAWLALVDRIEAGTRDTERRCIAILKAHGIDPNELGLRGDNEL